MERTCGNCDYSYHQIWNNGKSCHETRGESRGLCSTIRKEKFLLRRDKRSCENCCDRYCIASGCNDVRRTCPDMKYWQPIPEKQEKEMIKIYIPTSECTLSNIAKRIFASGCNEAHAEFSKVITKMIIDRTEVYIESEGKISSKSPLWHEITKTKKRFKWLLKEGFIEEDVWFEPCLYCHESNAKMDYKLSGIRMVKCMNCGVTGPEAETEEEARKKWNKN